ncbi:MAG: hypothetical protein QGI78_05730 [Phycisphaerales bacterium]|nr:hypothetical protein [Phycisphaerales bacterium]
MKLLQFFLTTTTIAISTTSLEAAPRKVVAENFTATWCTYCPDVANGLIMLQDEFPDTFFPLQIHCSDSYSTSWGDIRQNFYNVPGYPTVWMDGVYGQEGSYGSPSGNYTQLRSRYMQRQAAPTDVTITMCGSSVDTDTYSVSIEVGVEVDGTGKNLRLHCAQVLHDYPANPNYNYACFMQATSQDVTLDSGESTIRDFQFELNSASVANIENVSFIAWAQSTNASGPSEVYQAEKHSYNSGDCSIDVFVVGPTGDFATISDAITACSSNDSIQVMAGTYNETIDYFGKNILIESLDGPESTIIDGNGISGAVVTLYNSESSEAILRGFTVQGGNYVLGSGIVSNSTATIDNCIIRDNEASYGGGIYQVGAEGSGLHISNTYFCGNTPTDIHGVWFDEGGNVFDESCDGVCDADVSGDGNVNVTDLLAIVASWGSCNSCDEDVNGDGEVDVTDLLSVVDAWGPC